MKNVALQSRDNCGQAMIGLCLALFLVLGILGFFVYDMNRMQMAQRQLTVICDAAAMAGSAILSSQDLSYGDANQDQIYTAQTAAAQYAKNMFCAGAILGTRLYDPNAMSSGQRIAVNSVDSGSALMSVAANKVNVWIQLASPSQNNATYLPGNVQGRAFFIKAAYGYVPSLSALGIVSSLAVPAQSNASTQLLNVIMVFDCSGSMDDNTRVSFVERIWDNTQNKYNYQLAGNPGANNQLWQYTGLNYAAAPNGTAVNVLPPQNLTNLGYLFPVVNQATGAVTVTSFAFGGSNTYFSANPPLALDMAMRAYCAAPYLANSYPVNASPNGQFQGPYYDNDFGTPPGNCALKYGNQQASAVPKGLWGTGNVWDGNAIHGWGPDFSPGYYNASISNNNPPPPLGNGWDGNTYFYDPNAMPPPYNGSSCTPFTDLVVNLVNVNYPSTQPLDGGICPYAGLSSFTFPTSTFNVNFAEGQTVQPTYYYESSSSPCFGNTFKFPNIAYLVEASRGNLDLDNVGQPTNYVNALLGNSPTDVNGITMPLKSDCQIGYQMAYQRLAMFISQPFATAQAGAFKFFQNLAQNSAANFGFVGFSVAPTNAANPDSCAYLNTSSPASLFMNCAGNPTAQGQTLCDFFYQGYVKQAGSNFSINPNVWMWSPQSADFWYTGPSAPAATPTGIPYSATYNPSGPGGSTWIAITASGFSQPASTSISWAYTNLGFQIPRSFLTNITSNPNSANSVQEATFNRSCSNDTWSNYPSAIYASFVPYMAVYPMTSGYDGLWHCRPLADTDACEALQVALANVGVGSFSALTGGSAGTPSTMRAGAINVITFFTDGTPTDSSDGSFSNYIANVVQPAQKAGIPIYSIGLALNSSVKVDQYTFLNALTNKGANGSQFFQVTDANSLQAAFTGITKQLTQCQH